MPGAIGPGRDGYDTRHKLDLYGQTAAKHGYADLSIRETLDRCWQLKQVHVAATTERAVDEYRDSRMWYFEALGNRAMFGFSKETEAYEYYIQHESVLVGSSEKVGDSLAMYPAHTGIDRKRVG